MTRRDEDEALLFKSGSLETHFPSTHPEDHGPELKRQVAEHLETAGAERKRWFRRRKKKPPAT